MWEMSIVLWTAIAVMKTFAGAVGDGDVVYY
jgi:hypothetical protein